MTLKNSPQINDIGTADFIKVTKLGNSPVGGWFEAANQKSDQEKPSAVFKSRTNSV